MNFVENGFLRVAACVPSVSPGDVEANTASICEQIAQAAEKGARLVVFPELCVTGYTCADLFHNDALLAQADKALAVIQRQAENCNIVAVVGAPLAVGSALYNCAVVLSYDMVMLAIPKTYIPNYNEFYEKRWFASAPDAALDDKSKQVGRVVSRFGTDFIFGRNMVVECPGVKIGVDVCEDLWAPIPPSTYAALAGAQVIVNLSASNDLIGKYAYLRSLIAQQSARAICAYVYAGAGYGESSTDLVFDGKAIIAENGTILAANQRWQSHPQISVADIDIDAIDRDRMHNTTFADCARRNAQNYYSADLFYRQKFDDYEGDNARLLRSVSPLPFVPRDQEHKNERCSEIINIQTAGLARRLDAIRCKSLVVGISGGLDSTLALLVAVKAFDGLGLDRKGIVGITMPGFGTTGRTHNNAVDLMDALGVTSREIPIGPAVELHFADIGHDPQVRDVTYENCQARERTQILMDVANQVNGIVLGTGDLSELALGWATYNGDHMSMYGVNAGVPKTLVRHLVRYFAELPEFASVRSTLLDIVDTPISPELLPADSNGEIAQKTEDLVGPYELHDFFLYYMLRYGFSPRHVFALAQKAFEDLYSDEVVLRWMREFYRRFFQQQFKRSCLPDGPKVGSVCLSPRGDWRMPSDASARLWLSEIDEMIQGL